MNTQKIKFKLNPWQAIAVNELVNIDDLIDMRPGGIVRVKGDSDVRECVKIVDIRERTEYEKRFYRYRNWMPSWTN
jgi:hypothetical protein